MDDFWAGLPEELREKIIAHIPVPHLFALRLVCRRWDSLLSCPGFVRLRAQIPRPRNWILVPKWPTYQGSMAFVPESGKWINMPPFGMSLNLHVEFSAGSLLLLRTPIYSFPQRFHVYSPLRKISEQVVRCPSGLVVIRGSCVLEPDCSSGSVGSFRIWGIAHPEPQKGVDSSQDLQLRAVCYDSASGLWSSGARMAGNVIKSRSILMGSRLMLVLAETNSKQALFAYDLGKQKWAEIELPDDGALETSNWIVQCGQEQEEEALFLVQLNPFSCRLSIWRLALQESDKQQRWISEVQQQSADEKFVGTQNENEKRAALDDCIGIENRIILCKLPNLQVYHLRSKTWEWLPAVDEKLDLVNRAFGFCPML